MHSLSLLDTNTIPFLGLGTYKLKGTAGRKAITHALNHGYRHIDTAAMYRNEEQVGKAIQKSNVGRNEVWVTSKVWTSDLGYKQTGQAFEKTMDKLGFDYLDLYLIHWPGNNKPKRLGSWEKMIELQNEGRIKSIGVSNFGENQIQEIQEINNQWPAINQVHFSPFNYKKRLLEFCQSKNIVLTAYTPLEKGRRFDHPLLKSIASDHNKTQAQIMLRWAIQKNVVVIPKSSTPERIEENFNIFDFELTNKEMEQLDQI